MKSFNTTFIKNLVIPHRLIKILSDIAKFQGRQELYLEKAPAVLANLKQVALIESVDASNRIEDIIVGPKTIQAIVNDNQQPDQTIRAQGDVAGYRDVLRTIHDSAPHIPFSDGIILQFHRDLMKYSREPGGTWKQSINQIAEKLPDGTLKRIRFQPVDPFATPAFMAGLHEGYREALRQAEVAPLLLIPLYVLDFLCIHPFSDGNGRMSRLLTTLMLYHQGFEVCRYISLERMVERTSESYYDTLYTSSQGWHDGQHDPLPFTEYLLSLILGAYRELEQRSDIIRTMPEVKTGIVLNALNELIGPFSLAQLEKKCPLVSKQTIRLVLNRLRAEGRYQQTGRGPSSRWEKCQ
jgi:Fic family protein